MPGAGPIVVELEHADPGDVIARIARVLDVEASGTTTVTAVAGALAQAEATSSFSTTSIASAPPSATR